MGMALYKANRIYVGLHFLRIATLDQYLVGNVQQNCKEFLIHFFKK